MFRSIVLAAACLLMAACTTTAVQKAESVERPAAGARILLLKPDVTLGALTASGVLEPRSEWTEQATKHLGDEVQSFVAGKSHAFKMMDQQEGMAGRTGQLFRLHQAVGASILTGAKALPSKENRFDFTLGEGAQVLGETYDADYALFVYANGSWSTGGRVLTMLVLAGAGVSIPMGGQAGFASLVELETGRIVWFNTFVAGPGADMRTQEGAHDLVASLLKDIPL